MSHGRAGYSALHYEVKTGKKNLGEKGVSRCGSRFIKYKIGGVGYNYLVVHCMVQSAAAALVKKPHSFF